MADYVTYSLTCMPTTAKMSWKKRYTPKTLAMSASDSEKKLMITWVKVGDGEGEGEGEKGEG